MRKLIKRAWNWSWVVTLPVAIVFVLWGTRTSHRYLEFFVRQDNEAKLTLHRSGSLEAAHLVSSVNTTAKALALAQRIIRLPV